MTDSNLDDGKWNIEAESNDQLFEKQDRDRSNDVFVYTDPATDRYNTFRLISWWKQDIVRNATIMVVGAGALGNEVLKNLALMGVGKIFIVDFDTIDDSNLSRSVLFRACDNGHKKAEVAAEAIHEINPDVAVQWFSGDINQDLGLGVYRRMDVVIGCLDNRAARLAINEACWHLNMPWIDGAIQELFGLARVFEPNKGACYECTLTEEDYRIIQLRESCNRLARNTIIQGKVPTTPSISSIIGAVETQEALKILHGMKVDTGKALYFNGENNETFLMEYTPKNQCPSHWIYDEIIELKELRANKTTLLEMLQITREYLGKDSRINIPAFVTNGICPKCNKSTEIMRPLHSLIIDDGRCSNCGEMLILSKHEWVKGEESFLDRTLSQIGIPALDIIQAQNDDWEYKYFELTGDAEGYFNFERGTPEKLTAIYQRRIAWQMK